MACRLLGLNLRNIGRNIISAAVRRTEAASFHCNPICLGDNGAFDKDQPLPYMSVRKTQEKMKKEVLMSESAPPYQGISLMISLAVFMIYFFILREENDLDEHLRQDLSSKLSDVEEKVILKKMNYNRTHDIPTGELQDRLHEVQAGKQAKKSV